MGRHDHRQCNILLGLTKPSGEAIENFLLPHPSKNTNEAAFITQF